MPASVEERSTVSYIGQVGVALDTGFFSMAGSLGRSLGFRIREALCPFLDDENADATERRIGERAARVMIKRMGPDPRPRVHQYLAEMGKHLANHLKRGTWEFSIYSVNSTEINAWAVPGGYILVARMLLDLCKWNQNEVAFVLAHEMGHLVRGHARKKMRKKLEDSALFLLLGASGRFNLICRRLGRELLDSQYDHELEFDADALAVNLVMSGGFVPEQAIGFLRKLNLLKGPDGETDAPSEVKKACRLLSTHPEPEERIRKAESEMQARRDRSPALRGKSRSAKGPRGA
jgi:predicted Zn-dependent protease